MADRSSAGRESAMTEQSVNNVIRMILNGRTSDAEQIRNATYNALRRIGAKRDKTKAVSSAPDGSDQVDVRSVVVWAGNVQSGYKKAIRQLVTIDATAVSRTV